MNKIQSETEEIAKRLEEGVRDVFHSQKYMDYLKVMSQFHEYSLNNTLLIMMQRPSASIVAGYNAWKQMGRQVNRGEKGIRILAPSPYTLNIDTSEYSFGYIAGWSSGKDVKELKGSLEVIKGTASGMIKRIDESLAEVDKMIGLRKSCLSQLRKNQEIVKENNTTKEVRAVEVLR